MIRKALIVAISALIAVSSAACSGKTGADKSTEIVVSAAASLKDALTEAEAQYEAAHDGVSISLNFGSSGALKQQIENGAPADIFFSADRKNMDDLKSKGLLVEGSEVDVLGNGIVVASADEKFLPLTAKDLASGKVSRIAIGEPSSVPAGKYASEALENMGILKKVESKLVYAKDVKEALAWIESGNADVGFVYVSDLKSAEKSFEVMKVDGSLHSEIAYPAALVNSSGNRAAAGEFLNFLTSESGMEIFEKYGFTPAM